MCVSFWWVPVVSVTFLFIPMENFWMMWMSLEPLSVLLTKEHSPVSTKVSIDLFFAVSRLSCFFACFGLRFFVFSITPEKYVGFPSELF